MVYKPVRIRLNSKACKLPLGGCADKGSVVQKDYCAVGSNLWLYSVENCYLGANMGHKYGKCMQVQSTLEVAM